MKSFTFLCLFALALMLALLSADVSAVGVKGSLTSYKKDAKPSNKKDVKTDKKDAKTDKNDTKT